MLKPVITFVFKVLHNGLLEHSKKSNDAAKVKKKTRITVLSGRRMSRFARVYIYISTLYVFFFLIHGHSVTCQIPLSFLVANRLNCLRVHYLVFQERI